MRDYPNIVVLEVVMTTRREIVLINKHEGGPPSLLDKIEKLAKILSAVALPLIVGVGGWWIQDALSQRDVNQDYVELAISILSKPSEETPSELREWATSLLDQTSPVEIPEGLRTQLGGGEVRLPSIRSSSDFAPASRLPTSDPRSRLVASIARFDTLGSTGMRTCTAWLVSAFHVLTMGHCINQPTREIDAARVVFGYMDPRASDAVTSLDVVLPASEVGSSLDYAILSLEGAASLNRNPLPISTRAPQVGDKLFLLHHPGGRELSYSVQPCEVLALQNTIVTHDCDTLPGSGGAPLINADTLEVIGLHRAGSATEPDQKYAVRIDAVMAQSNFLRGLLSSDP